MRRHLSGALAFAGIVALGAVSVPTLAGAAPSTTPTVTTSMRVSASATKGCTATVTVRWSSGGQTLVSARNSLYVSGVGYRDNLYQKTPIPDRGSFKVTYTTSYDNGTGGYIQAFGRVQYNDTNSVLHDVESWSPSTGSILEPCLSSGWTSTVA